MGQLRSYYVFYSFGPLLSGESIVLPQSGKSLLHVLVENRLATDVMSELLDLLPNAIDRCITFSSELIESLVEQGQRAMVNEMDNFGCTALHYAARDGRLKVAKWLIGKGADIKAVDNNMNTVLHHSIRNGKWEFVEQLFVVFESDADLDKMNPHCEDALLASKSDRLEVVEYLIQAGADINATDKYGQTVLHQTARYEHWEFVELLVEKGADVNAKNIDDETVLHHATMHEAWEVVEWLIEKGADDEVLWNDPKIIFFLQLRFNQEI